MSLPDDYAQRALAALDGKSPDETDADMLRQLFSEALAQAFETRYPNDFLFLELRIDDDLDVSFRQFCRTDEEFDRVAEGFVVAIKYLGAQMRDRRRCPYHPSNLDDSGRVKI